MSTLPPPSDGLLIPVLVLGVLNLLVGIYSIRASYGYRTYARRVAARSTPPLGPNPPSVTLFVPCCGAEEDLEENLQALLRQNYPSLRVCFTVESREDSAVPVIERALERDGAPGHEASLVVAGPARSRAQKVHNLLAAMTPLPDSDVLVFADSDGRPEADWLQHLVAALERPGVGVASSYRFYLPEPCTFSTALRSVWNASALTLLGDHDHNFAWGGSMAIRRDVFERIGVREAWEGTLSDDYQMTHAVRRAKLRVDFVPGSLVGSRGRLRFGQLLSWCSRQIAITRVYWPALFRVVAATQVLYVAFLLLALVTPSLAISSLLAAVLALGFWSGGVRAAAIADLAPRWRPLIETNRWAYLWMVPLASVVTVVAVVRALLSRRIEWRGKRYEMRSPTETVILSRSRTSAGAKPRTLRP